MELVSPALQGPWAIRILIPWATEVLQPTFNSSDTDRVWTVTGRKDRSEGEGERENEGREKGSQKSTDEVSEVNAQTSWFACCPCIIRTSVPSL